MTGPKTQRRSTPIASRCVPTGVVAGCSSVGPPIIGFVAKPAGVVKRNGNEPRPAESDEPQDIEAGGNKPDQY